MDSEDNTVSTTKLELHNFSACMENASKLCQQMQYRSAVILLCQQVLEPIVLKIAQSSYTVEENTVKMLEILCHSFAQLVDVFFEALADFSDPESAEFLCWIANNKNIHNMLLENEDVDVTARLRFAGTANAFKRETQ